MTALLWYVVCVHALCALVFLARWWVRRLNRSPGYQITGYFAFLALGPAFGAARELRFFRVEVGGAIAIASAFFGTALAWALWQTHFRSGHPKDDL